ncbi:MAG: IS200/IS605 family transposase [Candidatus Anammoxibacter sp.]
MKRSLSHTVWECKYHIVWVPRRRRKIIYGKLKSEIGTILRRLCKYKGVEIVEGKACIDHIHICLSIPPKYAVSSIVGYLKGKSAMIVFENYSRLKRNFKGQSFWARGYYVSTVGLDEGGGVPPFFIPLVT